MWCRCWLVPWGRGFLFLLSTLTQPILSTFTLYLKKYKLIASIWAEQRGKTNTLQQWVVMLPGDTFVFNAPVDAWALSWQQRRYLQLPNVQKKNSRAVWFCIKDFTPSLVHTVYLYSYLLPFVMLPIHCATYICTTHTVHDILYQAQVSYGHDYWMQMLFDGNSVPDHSTWSEMSPLFICNLFVL